MCIFCHPVRWSLQLDVAYLRPGISKHGRSGQPETCSREVCSRILSMWVSATRFLSAVRFEPRATSLPPLTLRIPPPSISFPVVCQVIELVLRADVGLPHAVVRHLAQVEEKVLESLAWSSNSPLWEEIQANEGHLPTCQQVGIKTHKSTSPGSKSYLRFNAQISSKVTLVTI